MVVRTITMNGIDYDLSGLDLAILLATCAHRGQVDKLGKPYILHPLSVMLACDTRTRAMRIYEQLSQLVSAL